MVKQVVNQTKNTVAVTVLEVANNPWKRFWGLMGKPAYPVEYDGLWITPCADIHSFFLRFEFDAVFIDKSGEVLRIEERMKPWRLAFQPGSKVVLELDGGMAAQKGIAVGDVLTVCEV